MLKSTLVAALLVGGLGSAALAEPARLDPQAPARPEDRVAVRLDDQQLDRVVAGGIRETVQWFTQTVITAGVFLPNKVLDFLIN
jgi:hypothetical protein